MERESTSDAIRVIAMVFVICVHTYEKPWGDSKLVYNAVDMVLMLCNSLFFMLSGHFNLRKSFDCKRDYYSFYVKRSIDIILPFFLISIVLCVWNIHEQNVFINSYRHFIYYFVDEFFSGKISLQSWFMYPLIGYMVSTPFLSKMLHAMDEFSMKLMVIIVLIWNLIQVYFAANFGFAFSFSGWLLEGWLYCYVIGYIIDHCPSINSSLVYALGVFGYFIGVVGVTFAKDNYKYPTDLAPGFILFSMAAYLFFREHILIRNDNLKKILCFISKYSFLVFLLHWHVLKYVVYRAFGDGHGINESLLYVLKVFCTFAISLVAAIIIDIPMNYLKKHLKKRFKVC